MSYKRDDGTDIEVEYEIEQRGYPSNGWDDAGEPTIISIIEVTDADGNEVELTQAETDRIEKEIAAEVDEDDGRSEDDY